MSRIAAQFMAMVANVYRNAVGAYQAGLES